MKHRVLPLIVEVAIPLVVLVFEANVTPLAASENVWPVPSASGLLKGEVTISRGIPSIGPGPDATMFPFDVFCQGRNFAVERAGAQKVGVPLNPRDEGIGPNCSSSGRTSPVVWPELMTHERSSPHYAAQAGGCSLTR